MVKFQKSSRNKMLQKAELSSAFCIYRVRLACKIGRCFCSLREQSRKVNYSLIPVPVLQRLQQRHQRFTLMGIFNFRKKFVTKICISMSAVSLV